MPDRRFTVLLVDDHFIVRRALRRVLEDEPDLQVVAEASDGYEALKAAQNLKPDVVVMDFALPGLMGGATTQQILQFVPSTRVLILSMHSEESYVRAALDAGASGYLLKSATNLELPEAVRAIASGQFVLDSQIIVDRPALRDGRHALTPRELEVLKLIGHGRSNREIAHTLGISTCTAAVHRNNIMRALALRKAAKLTLYAIGRGFVGI